MRVTFEALAFVAGLSIATTASAQGLPNTKPEQVGFSSERLARLTATLQTEVAKGVIPGASLVIVREGRVAYSETFGVANPDTKVPVTKDTIFRIYSMTKPIVSVAAMMLVEEGKLALGEPVSKYIPQFKDVQVAVEKPGAD